MAFLMGKDLTFRARHARLCIPLSPLKVSSPLFLSFLVCKMGLLALVGVS